MSDTATSSQQNSPEILLTGFPGLLGTALVERLLDRGVGPIACVVQSKYRSLAEKRASTLTDTDSEIQLFEGDITKSGLELEESLDTLDAVTELYHLAAVYDLSVTPDLAQAVNVRGTANVLDTAEELDIDRFQYVSTCYVSGRYDGIFTSNHLQEGQTFNNHYERTKYEAEVLVQRRMADGLPATIYRPAIVVGDSETGETGKYDGPYYLFRLLLAQPRICTVMGVPPASADAELNVVPQDFVLDAITQLSRQSETVGEVYQLCDPTPLSVPAFIQTIATAMGRRLYSVPVPKSASRFVLRNLLGRVLPVEPATLDYLDHPTRYTSSNTRRALAGTGIECPPFESYVSTLVEFLEEHPSVDHEAMV